MNFSFQFQRNIELKIEDIEKIIYEKIPENNDENRKSFISSINRYQIKDNKYIDVSKRGINYKDLNSYTDRIIIRQLSQNNLICATYAKDLSLASQSFYNLKIWQSPVEEFNNEYLLGIINSTLLSYYFIKSFGSYKKLFPRILIEKIKALPVKIPETDDEKRDAIKIVENVRSILDDNKKIELIQKDLDSLIFDLYEIPDKYREYIQNFMRNI